MFNVVVMNLAPTGPLAGSDTDAPTFFSQEWWEIFLGVCGDARELCVRLWFYDQIGFSGANLQAELVRDHPDYRGEGLASVTDEGEGPLSVTCPPEGRPLAATVTRLTTGVPRALPLEGGQVRDASPGRRRLRLIYAVCRGFDYFNPEAGATLIDTVHGEFERRAGSFFGDVIVGSFQDELPSMPTWGATFEEVFRERAGYDLRPALGLLREGEGEEAQRVRADYHAARAALAERAPLRPLHAWHERHGLLCGFDQQGPARSGDPVATVETYADYPKTHRWFSAPGSDHHGDAKIYSSLAYLYGRPRTWKERRSPT